LISLSLNNNLINFIINNHKSMQYKILINRVMQYKRLLNRQWVVGVTYDRVVVCDVCVVCVGVCVCVCVGV